MTRAVLPISVVLTLALSVIAYGGGGNSEGTRGGGNAVVCYSSAQSRDAQDIVSVEMFDYWEQPQVLQTNLQLDLGNPSLGVKQKIDLAIARLKVLDPTRAARYEAVANTILSNIGQYLIDIDLSTLQDDDSRIQPASPCYKTQFAIQVKDPLSMEKKLVINRALWDAPVTSNDAKAGLLLHEIIYSDALDAGATDSDGVRHFNFLLATHYFDSVLTGADYWESLREAGLDFMLVLPGQAKPLLYSEQTVTDNWTAVKVSAPYRWEDSTKAIDLLPGDYVYSVYSSGGQVGTAIKCVSGCGRRILKLFGQTIVFSRDPNPNLDSPDVLFYPNGTPQRFYSEQDFHSSDSTFPIKGGRSSDCGKQVWSKAAVLPDTPSFDSAVELYPSGNLRSACLAEDTGIELWGDSAHTRFQDGIFLRGHMVLDEKGEFEEAYLARPIQVIDGKTLTLDFRVRLRNEADASGEPAYVLEYPSSEPISLTSYFQGYYVDGDDSALNSFCVLNAHTDGLLQSFPAHAQNCSPDVRIYPLVQGGPYGEDMGPGLVTLHTQDCPYISAVDCFQFHQVEIKPF